MRFERIKSIKSVGIKKSYDLSIRGKRKGYLINGIQTHNSGGDARADFSLEDTVTLFENAKEFAAKYPQVISSSKKIEGLVKNRGIHAAGLVVDVTDLFSGEKCVLVKGKEEELAVNWDKKDLEYMGMMKIDLLGLKTLNVLKRIKDLIKERHKKEIVWKNLKLDDEKVYDIFYKGDTIGIFQFGTAGMIQYLRQFKPKKFEDLIQVNALWRPGTIRSGQASEFVLLREGKKKAEYINDTLEKILGDTHGIVLYQEQMMYILNRLGNIPWKTTDVIRKVVSKSEGEDKFETFRQQFLAGVKELNSMPEADANKIFSIMKFMGSYSFNKSHSTEYSYLGYWLAWTKVYYPEEFYCASLQRADDDDLSELLGDANRHGFSFRNPDINLSGANWTIEENKILRAGFDVIKSISSKASEEIVHIREELGGKFKDFTQFYDKISKRLINTLKIKQLLAAGAFDSIISKEKCNRMYLFIKKEKRVSSNDKELDVINKEDVEGFQIDMSDVFNYELSENYFQYNKKLIELLSTKLEIVKLDVLKNLGDNNSLSIKYYIAKFDDIRYGYRGKVDKDSQTGNVKGYAGDLGGVYGILRDDTYSYYATFSGKLYHSDLKGKIEDCAGQYLLLKAEKPPKTSNIFLQDLFFMDDIKKGIFSPTLKLEGIIGETDWKLCNQLFDELKNCKACDGCKFCERPTPFACGALNVMIIGEAPGAEEEKRGTPFVGKAGQLLWETFKKFGFEMENFFVSNVLKCRPRDNKITDLSVVETCKNIWLAAEFEIVKPRLILAFGATAIKVITGNPKASVMDKTGTVEWNEKLGAWVVYSIHPAACLYESDRLPLLKKSVEIFLNLLGRLF